MIHYFGALASAKDTCSYFKSAYRGASAHYFVDGGSTIYQCVEDKNVSLALRRRLEREILRQVYQLQQYRHRSAALQAQHQNHARRGHGLVFDDATMENLVALTK